jgi:hypothetical protein
MAELTEPEVPATPAGDLVRAWMARTAEAAPHAALLLEVEASEATTRHLPVVVSPALLEHNLARRGIWSTEPDRRQTEFRYETEDVQGSLLIDYSLGQLSVADMRLVAWLLGRWRSDEAEIPFTMRRCTEEMGLAWKGPRARMIRDQLERIHGTRFKGRVYNARKKVHEEVWFGILDTVSFRDRRDRFDGEGEGTTIRVALSKFIIDNLKAAHFFRLDLGRLTSHSGCTLSSRASVGSIARARTCTRSLLTRHSKRRSEAPIAFAGSEAAWPTPARRSWPRMIATSRWGLRPGRARYSWVLRMRRRTQ